MAISGGDGSITLTTQIDEKGLNKGFSSIKSSVNSAGKMFTNLAKTAVAAFSVKKIVDFVKTTVEAYAEYEQLVGGVDTLFKGASQKLQDYASEAYRTAGMSANEYMQNVTSFSASLISSLGGDVHEAADVANMALVDMSDNANKMGSSLESITMAYQGFAKQNYTLLDNLKLGYGGTKTEMERLLKDAQALTGVKYDISNLSDVYNAIHAVQENLGIAGTTAKEAGSTIAGSAQMAKAAWKDLTTAMAGGGDIKKAMKNFTESVQTFLRNIVPVVESALSGIATVIPEILPDFIQMLAKAIVQAIPALISAIYEIIVGLFKGILEGFKSIFSFGSDAESSMSGAAASIEGATAGMQALGDATEEAGKKAKKSLASFDDLSILADNTASAEESVGFGNLSVSPPVMNVVEEKTENIKNNSEDTLSAWEEFAYEVLGEVTPRNFANLDNALLMFEDSAEKLGDAFSFGDVDLVDIGATIADWWAEGTTAGLTFQSGFMDVISSINDDDLNFSESVEGAYKGLGRMVGAGMQFAPDFSLDFLSWLSGVEITEDWFVAITEDVDNVYKGLSALATKALMEYRAAFNNVNTSITKTIMSGEIITPESLAGIQTQLDAAFGEVEAYITESETMAVESLNTLVAQGYLSEEQASELLRKTQESYDAQEKIISDNKARINEILTQASEENRALTAEEAAEIKQLMEESNAAAEATYLANVTDREQYVKDLMNQEEEWDAQRLSNVIQLANDIRDEEVAAAQKKYDESVAAANTLYYDLGAITEEEYNKMIAKAEEDRDKEVAAAEDKRAKTVAEAKGMAGDVANAVDSESGVIFSKWEQLWNKMWGKVKSIINSIIDAINSVISGTFSVGVTVADWLGLDFTEENIPKIPRLARGGVIPGGRSFLAVLGDQPKGQTNIEAPLQTIVDAFNIALSQNGGYSGNTEVVLEIDGREFGRAVVEKGNQESRRIGTRLAVT